jgi:ATP-dependent DNA helicase RecG
MAALHAIECGTQAALMAPTELLAEQHLANLRRPGWSHSASTWCWLAGKVTGKARASAMARSHRAGAGGDRHPCA